MTSFLKVHKTQILDGSRSVRLKGVNLGGWLMPEGYIMQAPNKGYRFFKKAFIKVHGLKAFEEIETAFRDNFIQQDDLARIKAMGCNSIRLPFHYGLIETKPYQYSKIGLGYLDRAIAWSKKNGLRVILDMHAAPGAQNHDWHSDSDGRALFWTRPAYQKRAAALWQFLADRYKDEGAVAGYDLLNETVVGYPKLMNRYYHQAIKAIRFVDKNHIIFVEGNRWGQDIACLDDFSDDNLVLGIHFYEPLEFTFNYIPGLKYPLGTGKKCWDKAFMRKRLESYAKYAQKCNRPLWCGEFGVHVRGGLYNENIWLRDVLATFKALDIHWHYWTWKAIKNHMFPDGVLSYYPNSPWVDRPGLKCGTGWDTWSDQWPTQKKAMIASWRTAAFTPNATIVKELEHAA